MDSDSQRRGFTLLELLVVIAIIAILLALTMAGIMRGRDAASRADSQNRLRQIILAVHHYADAHERRMPTLAGKGGPPLEPVLFVALLPYVEHLALYNEFVTGPVLVPPPVGLYISPADPTAAEAVAEGEGVASFAANAQLFQGTPRLPGSFIDGTSNTIAFAEHYAYHCQGYSFYYWYPPMATAQLHPPSFADDGDDVPSTSGSPPVTTSYIPGLTFQAAPSISLCMPHIAQTPHPGGMLVALGDGSVRILSPGISEATYWGAVTPASGEILGSDW